jgi:hypothetical protein
MKAQYSIGVFLFIALLVVQTGVASAATTANLFPTADGVNHQWSSTATSSHFSTVDETTCNGLTDYVSTTLVSQRDSYQVPLTAVPNGAYITSISLKPCASRSTTGSGTSTLGMFYRFNSATSSDMTTNLPTGTTPVAAGTFTFSGLLLSKDASTTFEAGVVYKAGTRGIRLSNLATVISYITAIPNAPTNLVATTTTGTSTPKIALFWTDNSTEEQGFAVERGLDGVNFSSLATTTLSSYTDATAATGTPYYYRVRAYNQLGSSDYATSTPYSL